VLKALRDHAIEVAAIHNHILDDQPRLFFMHFWANDDAVKLAEGLKMAPAQSQHSETLNMFARAILLLGASLIWATPAVAQTAGSPLVIETKIPLGDVSGRIDHLGIDVQRQRLFVAELGNNSLGVVDLASGKVRTIAGFSEPQGVAYVASVDSVYVANGGDGSVRVLRGDDLAPVGRIKLGDDADNVRVDASRNRVLVGYGNGAIAVIDPATRTKVADIRLKGHP
jgi:DNA-binding beta-propeller fold protein YncE